MLEDEAGCAVCFPEPALAAPCHAQGFSKANKGSAEEKARKNVLVSKQALPLLVPGRDILRRGPVEGRSGGWPV